MAQQYVIKSNGKGGHDVFWRQVFTSHELHTQKMDLVRDGWDPDDAEAEVSALSSSMATVDMSFDEEQFIRCNEDPNGAPIKSCREFVLKHVKMGDVICEDDSVFMVNAPQTDKFVRPQGVLHLGRPQVLGKTRGGSKS
jgi:hypothetical protein